MSVLDSDLEALAFGYVSSGILAVVNNLWTWIAVVTAAVSFWRIRATASPAPFSLPSDDHHHRTADIGQSEPTISDAALSDDHRLDEKPPAVLTAASGPSLNDDGVTKGKFTVHFGECDGGREDDEGGELTGVREDDREVGEWWERWERVLRIRKGEDEWYRHQDLMAINGNVVRLWEQHVFRPESYRFSIFKSKT